eukprot:scaffold67542_cov63-Phaeocystis_antarctica.AAC.4
MFAVSSLCARGWPVSGEVSWSLSQYSMACRSYVCPSCVTTGSSMSSCVMGQMNAAGRFSSRPRLLPLAADRLVAAVAVAAAVAAAPELPAAAAKEDWGRCVLGGARCSREVCVSALRVVVCDLHPCKGSIIATALAAAPEQGASGDQPGAGRPGADPALGKAGAGAGAAATGAPRLEEAAAWCERSCWLTAAGKGVDPAHTACAAACAALAAPTAPGARADAAMGAMARCGPRAGGRSSSGMASFPGSRRAPGRGGSALPSPVGSAATAAADRAMSRDGGAARANGCPELSEGGHARSCSSARAARRSALAAS